jgi:hypothetical protein
MSELSEAMERATKRLSAMSERERAKRYHIVLREELQRRSGPRQSGGQVDG